MAYLPSPGNVNQIVARVNPWRSRIPRTKATPDHGRQERGTKRSVPNQAHLHHLLRGALCAQIKETLQLPDHPPIPLTMESAYEHKKRDITRDHLQHRRKLSVPSPQRLIHPPSTHPTPSPWRASTAGMQNKDVPISTMITHIVPCTGTCPLPISHHDLFHPPQKSQLNRGVVKDLAKKDPQEAEVTLSSESDSDSYYLDYCFDSVSAPDQHLPTPTRGHPLRRMYTQEIEACYKTPVGHFHVQHKALKSGSSAPEACKPKTCRKEETSRPETTTDTNEGEAERGPAGGIKDP
jgi:hypothetical protein